MNLTRATSKNKLLTFQRNTCKIGGTYKSYNPKKKNIIEILLFEITVLKEYTLQKCAT